MTMIKHLLKVAYFVPIIASGLDVPEMLSQDSSQVDPFYDGVKVPVQLGVMSRCPDALLCENVFNQVLEKVSEKVNLSLVYLAKLSSEEPEFGVKCMHGAEECAGNVQQLCVAQHEPAPKWWEFVQCQNYEGRENIGKPEIALKCARVSKIEWETSKAGRCAGIDGSGKGSEGINLLKKSIALSQRLHIEKSCTVLISGRKVCVHDETWKECENGHTVNDFVKQINDEYERLNSDLQH